MFDAMSTLGDTLVKFQLLSLGFTIKLKVTFFQQVFILHVYYPIFSTYRSQRYSRFSSFLIFKHIYKTNHISTLSIEKDRKYTKILKIRVKHIPKCLSTTSKPILYPDKVTSRNQKHCFASSRLLQYLDKVSYFTFMSSKPFSSPPFIFIWEVFLMNLLNICSMSGRGIPTYFVSKRVCSLFKGIER